MSPERLKYLKFVRFLMSQAIDKKDINMLLQKDLYIGYK